MNLKEINKIKFGNSEIVKVMNSNVEVWSGVKKPIMSWENVRVQGYDVGGSLFPINAAMLSYMASINPAITVSLVIKSTLIDPGSYKPNKESYIRIAGKTYMHSHVVGVQQEHVYENLLTSKLTTRDTLNVSANGISAIFEFSIYVYKE